ncbi:alcohol dehydrogenase family protein [Oceanobacillus sp. M60]|uniref:alcohol dehydrogenase family protein n=1 Tax=Oceanobacillus TaxID=182709 RepID=UPI0021165805|nr:alcohol dehydrogenase family protein [Oceanobacillus oncorhynchi]UUI41548.1 alcohol dehydrogenase family protein [Oceanobacillus oncorhynchi]
MNTIPKKMRGVYLTGNGGFEKLEYRTDIDVPTPKAGEVLVKIGGAAVNNTDVNTRIGWYSKSVKSETNEGGASGFKEEVTDDGSWLGKAMEFPRIQGADGCGIIVAVGEGVSQDRLGERILIRSVQQRETSENGLESITFGSECDGAFAEYATVLAEEAFVINSSLSDKELATFPCSYGTAENLISRVGVEKDDVVLVTGASGGVGAALVQLVKVRGAKVIAVCGSDKVERVKSYGADEIIYRGDSYVEKIGKMKVDVVLDVAAGKMWPELLEVLKKGGKYGVIGAIGGPLVELDVRDLYLKDLSLFGSTYQTKEAFQNLIRYIEEGKIKPAIAKEFPLKDIVEAQKAFLSKTLAGKFIIDVTAK